MLDPESYAIRMTVAGVAFSPDGNRLATASWDQTAKAWDEQSGKELLTLRGHSNWVYGVAFSPDGKRLATAGRDGTAKVWEAQSGKELLTLRGHLDAVRGVAFSPDGKRLATASADGTVQVYALDLRELLNLVAAASPATSLPTSVNATSNPRPARPCLKFRMLRDQTCLFVRAIDSPLKNKCSQSADCFRDITIEA